MRVPNRCQWNSPPRHRQLAYSVTKIQQSSTSLSDTASKLLSKSDSTTQKITAALTSQPINPTAASQLTTGNGAPFPIYAGALVACTASPISLQSSTLSGCNLHAQQTLIDNALNALNHDIVSHSKADILTKANQATMITPALGTHQPPLRIIGIKKLPSRVFT